MTQTLSKSAGTDARWQVISKYVAFAAVASLVPRIFVWNSLTIGAAIAIALLPVTSRYLFRYVGGGAVAITTVLAVVAGIVLSQVLQGTHRIIVNNIVSSAISLVTLIAGVAVVLWARQFLRIGAIGVAFGIGMLLSIDPAGEMFRVSPWRFGFSVPVTVLVLGICELLANRWIELVALMVLVVASALAGGRSTTAILVLTAALVLWQLRPDRSSRRSSPVRIVIGVGALAIAVYNIGEALVLEGILGEAAQQRSVEQIDASGSLLLGGRPELAATVALMAHRPLGLGAGTNVNSEDLIAAKEGMRGVNYDPNNSYVEDYMFGSGVELHSGFGDLWVKFGVVGLILAGMLIILNIRTLAHAMTNGIASGLVVYVGAKTLWNLFFSPLGTSLSLLILSIGIGMYQIREHHPHIDGGPRVA